MINNRDDTEFDEGRSKIFMRHVNGLLSRSEELPTDSFTANAVLGHYLWTYRPSTLEDVNPHADKQKEREGWVVAMFLGHRTLQYITQQTGINELPDKRRKITADVIADTAEIIRAEQGGTNGDRLVMQPRIITPEEDALVPFGIKERVENLYQNGYIQSPETALGIVLLAGVVDTPKSLSQEKLDKLKLTARKDIRERLEITRNVTRQYEGMASLRRLDESTVSLKRLVGYERDGIAPQTIDQMVTGYKAANGGQSELIRNLIEHEIASGLGSIFNTYVPPVRKYA